MERTELRIDGANCSTCLNATLDALRAIPGVTRAASSATAGCLAIEHDGIDEGLLLDAVRANLHGVARASTEIVMVSVEPLVAALHCRHGATDPPPAGPDRGP